MSTPALSLDPERRTRLQVLLLDWFAQVRRDLPWRHSRDLYGIWISEIMLQQTTVQTVVPFWERFVQRWPDVHELACADEAEVLGMWTGLGYYSRARNLHAAARRICIESGGRLPQSREAWARLPGVGPYASGAIASLGLGEAVPALDANARRVIMRWAVRNADALSGLSAAGRIRLVDGIGAALVPAVEPGTWNEALMELGALVCRARHPACEECPVRDHCGALAGDCVADVPPPRNAAPAAAVWAGVLLVTWRSRVMLVPPATPAVGLVADGRLTARRDFAGLHRGLWGVPCTPWLAGPEEPQPAALPWSAWLDGLVAGGLSYQLRPCGHFRHAITRYRLRVSVWEAALDSRRELPPGLSEEGPASDPAAAQIRQPCFAAPDSRLPISGMTEKALHFHRNSVV